MKDCGVHNPSQHLKNAIEYITKPEKTNNGIFTGAVNCFAETAYSQMIATKEHYGKSDKRQGYHLIISFPKGEVTAEKAFEIIGKFTKEYLGAEYEAIYTVHNNTEKMHGHVIFNSVNSITGKKFHYKKGDWAKNIQPIVNKLCLENGLSTIDIEGLKENLNKDGVEIIQNKHITASWSNFIKKDIDLCVLQATTLKEMLDGLKAKGYEVKYGKHIAVRPEGMVRFRRLDTLGEEYTQERLNQRILQEKIITPEETVENQRDLKKQRVNVFRGCYKRPKLTSIQRKYFKRMYQIGRLKKKPYSQIVKFKKDIQQLEKLQKEYLFLKEKNIHTSNQLEEQLKHKQEKLQNLEKQRKNLYNRRYKFKETFRWLKEIEDLTIQVKLYENGDIEFKPQYEQKMELINKIQEAGYELKEITIMKKYFHGEIFRLKTEMREVRNEIKILESIYKGDIEQRKKYKEIKQLQTVESINTQMDKDIKQSNKSEDYTLQEPSGERKRKVSRR